MNSPIQNKILTVFIPVSDIEQAASWYCKILGLPADGEVLFGHLYILPMQGRELCSTVKSTRRRRYLKRRWSSSQQTISSSPMHT